MFEHLCPVGVAFKVKEYVKEKKKQGGVVELGVANLLHGIQSLLLVYDQSVMIIF